MQSKPARRVSAIEISGAFGNCPLLLASLSFFSVGGSVLELLSTSDMENHQFAIELYQA